MTRRAARYRVIANGNNQAILTDVESGETREYWCPRGGGYVYQVSDDHPGTLGLQVCGGLWLMGSTLSCSATESYPLVALIRYEARARYRAMDRDEERGWL